MFIRYAEEKDIKRILKIYESARKYMAENGNPSQWRDNYPSEETVRDDMGKNHLHVAEESGEVTGVFAFIIGEDDTYSDIEGRWLSEGLYGTIHRIAKDRTGRGILKEAVSFCQEKIGHLRIDTHRDNEIMKRLIIENGFTECGVICGRDGRPRIAYEKIFEDRLLFIGLQGSYGRGEATEDSDIDPVVILDHLDAADIKTYERVIDRLDRRELVCGFLSGRQELLNWEPSDLFQFYYDTIPVRGSIDEILSLIDLEAIERAAKSGACNIYHACVHNMLYEKSLDILKGLYKAATFVIRAVSFTDTGEYTSDLISLAEKVCLQDRNIIYAFSKFREGRPTDFEGMSEALFSWAKKQING